MLPIYQTGPTLKSAKAEKPRLDRQSMMLTVFPTNATSEVIIGYPAEADGISELLLYDLDGGLIKTYMLNGKGFLSISTTDLAIGNYILVLKSNDLNLASGRFNKLK